MYPPDVIQFNLTCMTIGTENADELKRIGTQLLDKYADQQDTITGIQRNLETLDYRTNHDKKNDSRPGHRIFTPLGADSGKRIQMYVSDDDHDKVTRGPGYKGIVTDVDTGARWKVWGASCGISACYCDAMVERA